MDIRGKRIFYASLFGSMLLATAVSGSAYVMWTQAKSSDKPSNNSNSSNQGVQGSLPNFSRSSSPNFGALTGLYDIPRRLAGSIEAYSSKLRFPSTDWNVRDQSNNSYRYGDVPKPHWNSSNPSSRDEHPAYAVSFNAIRFADPYYFPTGTGIYGTTNATSTSTPTDTHTGGDTQTGTDTHTSGGSITPTPEPEVYAMMLLGLGMVSHVAHRRKIS